MGEEMHKIFLAPEAEVNVALAENGAKMVKPEMEANCLNGDLNNWTHHEIGKLDDDGSQEGIVIELCDNFLLNRIQFQLYDQDDRSYSYYLEVSMDGKYWTRMCDYSKYICRSLQTIAFPRTVLRFIKIVGTYNSVNQDFHVVTVQAYIARNEAELDRKWNLLGLLVPRVNVANVELGAKVIHGIGGNNLIYGVANFTYHTIGFQPIVLQLSQPYILDSMRLHLLDDDDRVYNYEIKVSTDSVNWTTVARRQNVRSWQNLKFERVPVVFVRIMGTYNSHNSEFHVVRFECPSQQAAGDELEVQA